MSCDTVFPGHLVIWGLRAPGSGDSSTVLLGPNFLSQNPASRNAEPGLDILRVFINNATICEAHCGAIKMQMHLLYFKTMTRVTGDKLIR